MNKFNFIWIFALFLLFTIPFAEASALTDSVKDKIEFWWQGYNGASQVTERIFNNHANMTGSGGTSAPIGVNFGVFPSHNDSTSYFGSSENGVLSSYTKFGIVDIKNDSEGGWCVSGNFSSTSVLTKAVASLSDGTAAVTTHIAFQATDTNIFQFDRRVASAAIITFTFGSYANGQKTFVCMGNTGERFWAFQNGTNQTLTFSAGSNVGSWYINFTTLLNGTFGATPSTPGSRLIYDESGTQIDFIYYFNDTPTTEELIELWNGTTLGSDPLNYTNVFAPAAPDTTSPYITAYSDQGSSCSNWNTNPSNACSTSDTTPTLYFNTSESAFCAIGTNNTNYTTMGSLRNCTSGEGAIEHACTLIDADELVYEDSIVYSSCKDASGNMNTSSTSGALNLTVTGLEAAGRTSIGIGIQNALLSSYTNYTDLQIYARNLSNSQVKGTFDRAAKKGSKMWAFNYITKGEQHVQFFNLTPVLYVLEMSNITGTNITKTVETMINATK
ncbi:hypothetical protein J4234_04100 [Candidatus Woesearchaeota archaeon]|nr:hypothetical protein [Candidatus Woesearchaeota archaeon]